MTSSELLEIFEHADDDEFEKSLRQFVSKVDGVKDYPKETECFYCSRTLEYDGNPCFGLITSKFFILCSKKRKVFIQIPLHEMVGIHPLSKEGNDIFGLNLGYISIKKKKFIKIKVITKGKKEEDDFVLTLQQISFFGEKTDDGEFEGMESFNRSALIVINPVSGAKRGVKIFENVVKPIFDFSHFTYESIITEKPGHAIEIARTLDPDKFNMIVSIGGDGNFYELLQGLFHHPRISYNQLKRFSLSPIPAGTGNGLSISMGSDLSCVLASLITIRGRTVPYNVTTILTPKQRLFSFLFFIYGVGSEIDLGFKAIKWMGDFKYVIASMISLLQRKTYRVELEYVQIEGDTSASTDAYVFPKQFGNSYLFPEIEVLEGNEKKKYPPLTLLERHFPEELASMVRKREESTEEEEIEEEEGEGEEESEEENEGGEDKENSSEESEEINEKGEETIDIVQKKKEEEEEETSSSESEETSEDEESDDGGEENFPPTVVTTIKEDVFFLNICNSRKNSQDFWGAPQACPGNGYVDLIWGKKMGLIKSAKGLSKMVAKEPTMLESKEVYNSARIKAFCFKPVGENTAIVDLDGEELEASNILGMVHKGLISVCHLEVPFVL